MDINSDIFVNELVGELKREISLYQQYHTLLNEERKFVIKFDEDRLRDITSQRADVLNQIVEVQKVRQELVKEFPHYREMRLHDLVIKNLQPKYAKQVLPLITDLRKIVKKSIDSDNQFSQILNFSLRSVQGVLSILWSATQNVVKSYNRKGCLQSSYHPSDSSRASGILRKA